jgi:hypothetical protein
MDVERILKKMKHMDLLEEERKASHQEKIKKPFENPNLFRKNIKDQDIEDKLKERELNKSIEKLFGIKSKPPKNGH